MSWTTAADLHGQVQKRWDKGELLAQLIPTQFAAEQVPALFPLRLRLLAPTSADLAARFDEVRNWITSLRSAEATQGWRIVWREVNHRVVGSNALPNAVWLHSLGDALAVLGKQAQAERFSTLAAQTLATYPTLQPWLVKNTLKVLALEAEWTRLMSIVAWLVKHPRPGIYLRQVSVTGREGLVGVSGIDSKFIESHRAVLAELLDVVLPANAIDTRFSGVGGFALRYGFRDKPLRIRFRVLDPALALIAPSTDQDITLTQAAFGKLGDALGEGFGGVLGESIQRVFFTENEVNFLAFPPVPRSMVVFGAGYGFEVLAGAAWLHQCRIHYWGDIDTHGFAILDQLRAHLPHVQSLLMDRQTLMAHRDHWGKEPQPLMRDLLLLDAQEHSLFDDLRHIRLSPGSDPSHGPASLRLEQERIGFDWLLQALAALPAFNFEDQIGL